MSGNTSKIIAFNYTGGKFTITDKLEKFFPEHIHFIDVFSGSGVVTFNKRPSKIETINDINGDIVNFFRVLRDNPYELYTLLYLTPTSRDEFDQSWNMEGCSDLERARRFYVRVRQSYFSMGAQNKNKGWHMVKTQSRSNMAETISKWKNAIQKLWPVIDRLTSIQIENRDFRELIQVLDFDGAFFYCDPPYPKEVRASYNDYRYELSDKDHYDLAEILHHIKGKAMISGYNGPIMERLYGDWFFQGFSIKQNNIRKKPVRECIWMNYDPSKINGKQTIFDFTTHIKQLS